jgi:hypothetical protein
MLVREKQFVRDGLGTTTTVTVTRSGLSLGGAGDAFQAAALRDRSVRIDGTPEQKRAPVYRARLKA